MRRHARSICGIVLVAGAMWAANLFPSPPPIAGGFFAMPFLWVAPLLVLAGLWLLGAVKQERLNLSALPALCLTALFLALYGAGDILGLSAAEGSILPELIYCAVGMPCAFLTAYGALAVAVHIAAVVRKKERPAFSARWALFYLGFTVTAVALDFALLRLRSNTLSATLGDIPLWRFALNLAAYSLAGPIAVPYVLSLFLLRFTGIRRWTWPALCAVGCAFFWFSFASPTPYLGLTRQAIALPLWLICMGVTSTIVSRWRAKEARWAERKQTTDMP